MHKKIKCIGKNLFCVKQFFYFEKEWKIQKSKTIILNFSKILRPFKFDINVFTGRDVTLSQDIFGCFETTPKTLLIKLRKND